MPRQLDTATLDKAALQYAAEFMQPDRPSATTEGVFVGGRGWVVSNLHNATFKDEYDYLLAGMLDNLGPAQAAELALITDGFADRTDTVLDEMLRTKLAVDREGNHLEGAVGQVQVGARFIRMHAIEVETPESIAIRRWARANGRDAGERQTTQVIVPYYWPVYAGEAEERAAGSMIVDPLPEGADPHPAGVMLANNPRISNEAAQAGITAITDKFNEGTSNGIIQGRTGAQPADPDTAVTGTLLFTNALSNPAVSTVTDGNPGGVATLDTISDDTSADATGTLGYCRISATNDGSTPIDDHVDGEAGAAAPVDFLFNTVAIVAGSTVSFTSGTLTQPES